MTEPKRRATRTCIACRKQSSKAALKRVVRCPDGTVRYDESGRLPGRGAYLCSLDCLNVSLKANKLQRALKANLEQEDAEKLAEELNRAFAQEEVR